jgi:hypothetical protein
VTIETLTPTSALTKVDLPAFGAPMTAMKADFFMAPNTIYHVAAFAAGQARQ